MPTSKTEHPSKTKPIKKGSPAPPEIAALSVPELLAKLNVNPESGLSKADVDLRRVKSGANEVAEVKAHPLKQFLLKFWGVSAWMLELIIVVSAVLGNYPDLAVVGVLLVMNAVLGFLQERRAEGVVQALQKQLQVSARVLRDSAWSVIPARELVPGDILRIRGGDIVPADIKLLTGTLSVDQSALTGESKDVAITEGGVVSSGSVIRRGEGNGLVMLTGANTFFGRTTQLVQLARPKLHIEAVIGQVVRLLFGIVSTLLAVIVILSLARGESLLKRLPLLLVLHMSAVPVALPVLLTISMAVGSKELAKQGVLVTRLSASEDAATMDVLCVDKTGTITMNQLAVMDVMPQDKASESDVLFAAALASEESNQDPIDLAFRAAAKDRDAFKGRGSATPISFVPFDAATRRTESVVEVGGRRIRSMKGAVETIASACGLVPAAVALISSKVTAAAAKGYRTLAVASGPEAGPIALLGLVSLYDPPRPDAKELIATLKDHGIAVKMLTGDALAVAAEIAAGVGLSNIRRMPGGADAETKKKTIALLEVSDGLAEVFPEDKYLVVKTLQTAGHITGMTGDGVNDAPALRQAEVGIAVSTATDVAKSSASVVLTEAGLTNIVSLVQQGRTIYQRILTWIVNKISHTILKSVYVSVA